MTGTDPTHPTHPTAHTEHQPLARPRVFEMVRHEDVTGFSGVGVVADGVEFPDGSVAFRWRGPYSSTVVFEAGTDAVITVHGHGGATEIRWVTVGPAQPHQPEGHETRHDPHWPPPIGP